MNAVPRNSILIILSIVSRTFCAVSNGTLNKNRKEREDKMQLKRFYRDIANIRSIIVTMA